MIVPVNHDFAMAQQSEEQLSRARILRKAQTTAECAIWRQLRAKRLDGLKFRRQYPCGPYYLDFYCASKQIAIELDGGGHASEEQARYDEMRSEYLRKIGIKVLRFWNNDVLQRTDGVLQVVWNEIRERESCPGPSP